LGSLTGAPAVDLHARGRRCRQPWGNYRARYLFSADRFSTGVLDPSLGDPARCLPPYPRTSSLASAWLKPRCPCLWPGLADTSSAIRFRNRRHCACAGS